MSAQQGEQTRVAAGCSATVIRNGADPKLCALLFSTQGQGELQLLHNITGSFRPGVLTALMGVSGAGKVGSV